MSGGAGGEADPRRSKNSKGKASGAAKSSDNSKSGSNINNLLSGLKAGIVGRIGGSKD